MKEARHSERRAFDVSIVIAVLRGVVGMLGVPGCERALLDALDAVTENAGDDLLGLFVAGSIGVEVRLPVDDGAVRLIVRLDPQLRLIVLYRQGAFDDLVGVGEILGAGQLFLDLGAVFERQVTDDDIALFGFLASGDGRMPLLDLAECARDRPHLGRKSWCFDPFLDRDRGGRGDADNQRRRCDQGQSYHVHAFPPHCNVTELHARAAS